MSENNHELIPLPEGNYDVVVSIRPPEDGKAIIALTLDGYGLAAKLNPEMCYKIAQELLSYIGGMDD